MKEIFRSLNELLTFTFNSCQSLDDTPCLAGLLSMKFHVALQCTDPSVITKSFAPSDGIPKKGLAHVAE